MKHRLIFTALLSSTLLLTGMRTMAQTRSFTLDQAQQYAIDHNQNLKNARLDVDVARRTVSETTSIGLPQVNASIGYNNFLDLATQLIPAKFFDPTAPDDAFAEVQFGTKHNASADLTASQLVFSGPYIVGLRAAKTYKKVSEQAYEKSLIDTRVAIAQNYYLVLLSEIMEQTVGRNVDNLKRLLFETEEMFKKGFVGSTDVDQLKITLNTLENTMRSFERQTVIARKMLKFQMGMDISEQIELSQSLNEIITATSLEVDQNVKLILEENIDYQMMKTNIDLQELLLKKERAETLPNVAAFLSHTQNAMRNDFDFFDSDGDWFPTTVVGASINIPIIAGGQRHSKIEKQKLELQKVKNTAQLLEQSLQLQLEQAVFDYNNAYEKYITELQSKELSEKIYDQTSVKYKKGMASSMELTQANDQFLNTQSSYSATVIELLNAKLEVDKILGKIK